MTIRQVTFEGFQVSVEMDDGMVYPFRTHPEAARLFATAPALLAACEKALNSGAIKFADNALDRGIREALLSAVAAAKGTR